MHLSEGTILQGGRYRIIRFISSGGFGNTYEAAHETLPKRFAIKEFFVKDFCERDEYSNTVTVPTQSKQSLVLKLMEKFVDEAKSLSVLDHPGIVRVSDVFEENGTAYFVMNFIEGRTLADINRTQVLPEAKVLEYMTKLADALKYVHLRNRLHLDIKPANIIIDNNDNPVLIDFGASKQYDEVEGENTSTLIAVTPGFAPLEQIGNNVVKFLPATDIYALGATMYRLLTGKTPPAANLLATGQALEPISDTISAPTRATVYRCMHTLTNMRPADVDQFISMLHDKSISEDDVTCSLQLGVAAAGGMDNPITGPLQESQSQPISQSQQTQISSIANFGKNKKSIPAWVWAVIGVLVIAFVGTILFSTFDKTPESDPEVKEKTVETTVKGLRYTSPVNEAESFEYTGEFILDENNNKVPNGKGEGVYKKGVYTGEYVKGVREGEAEYKTSTGDNYFVGRYKNDKYEKGKLYYDSTKTIYFDGEFKDNQPYNGEVIEKGKPYGKYVNGQYVDL